MDGWEENRRCWVFVISSSNISYLDVFFNNSMTARPIIKLILHVYCRCADIKKKADLPTNTVCFVLLGMILKGSFSRETLCSKFLHALLKDIQYIWKLIFAYFFINIGYLGNAGNLSRNEVYGAYGHPRSSQPPTCVCPGIYGLFCPQGRFTHFYFSCRHMRISRMHRALRFATPGETDWHRAQ